MICILRKIRSIMRRIIDFILPGEISESKYSFFDRPVKKSEYYIKFVKALLKAPYYRLLMRIFRPRNIMQKKYYVSICAIFRDEGYYLKEWIEFHKIIGIEHFYLYNNFSQDNYLEVLAPYIQAGEVTLIDWPVPQGQMSAYQDCFNKFRDETNWFAFIDIDEFIVPNKTDTIGEFLKPFELKRPAVLLYWRHFGASGLISRDINGLVVEDFKVCWRKYVNIGKILFNTAYDLDVNDKHNVAMHHIAWGESSGKLLPPVNCFDRLVLCYAHAISSGDLPVQINHYVTKSYHEFFDRKIRLLTLAYEKNPQVSYVTQYFLNHNKKCQALDLHAYKYIIQLKLNMRGNKSDEL